jgi:hypothetical protein
MTCDRRLTDAAIFQKHTAHGGAEAMIWALAQVNTV